MASAAPNARAAIPLAIHKAAAFAFHRFNNAFSKNAQRTITKPRNKISSPIPAVADARIDKGIGGCSNPCQSPKEINSVSIVAITAPAANPITKG